MKKKNIIIFLLLTASSFAYSSPCENAMIPPQEPQMSGRARSLETALKNSSWYALLKTVANDPSFYELMYLSNFAVVKSELVNFYFNGAASSVGYELLSTGKPMKDIMFAIKKMIRKKKLRKQLNQIPLNNPEKILRSVIELAEAIGEPTLDLLENVLLDPKVQTALTNSQLLKKSQLNLNWTPSSKDIAEFITEIIVPFKGAVDSFKTKHPEFMKLKQQSEDRAFIAMVAPAVFVLALSPVLFTGAALLDQRISEANTQEAVPYEWRQPETKQEKSIHGKPQDIRKFYNSDSFNHPQKENGE